MTTHYCRWCDSYWDRGHDCPATCDWTLPCFACGTPVPSRPSGYGSSVDFGGFNVSVKHEGFSRNELFCSQKCVDRERSRTP